MNTCPGCNNAVENTSTDTIAMKYDNEEKEFVFHFACLQKMIEWVGEQMNKKK